MHDSCCFCSRAEVRFNVRIYHFLYASFYTITFLRCTSEHLLLFVCVIKELELADSHDEYFVRKTIQTVNLSRQANILAAENWSWLRISTPVLAIWRLDAFWWNTNKREKENFSLICFDMSTVRIWQTYILVSTFFDLLKFNHSTNLYILKNLE